MATVAIILPNTTKNNISERHLLYKTLPYVDVSVIVLLLDLDCGGDMLNKSLHSFGGNLDILFRYFLINC